MNGEIETQINLKPSEMLLHLGPQHPLQPGPFLLDLVLEGETVKDATLEMGFIHKGIEKILENRTYLQCIPITDRMCYLASISNNEVFCSGVESLMGIEPTERAKYIRTIMLELTRIQSHLLGIGEYATDIGFLSMFLWMIREREPIISLLEMVTGARLNHSFVRFGGVAYDLPAGFKEKTLRTLNEIRKKVEKHDEIMSRDSVYLKRTKGVGVLSRKAAMELGVAGPAMRGSGVDYDIRKVDPYLLYPDLDFKVITAPNGDVFDRVKVRLSEILESIYIIEQCIDMIPGGPFKQGYNPYLIKPKPGEVYSRVEDPRGEMGMYIVSDGTFKPYRVKVRGPAFATMQALPPLLKGAYMADVAAIASSMDSCTSEVDR